jgi:hypothetical protein
VDPGDRIVVALRQAKAKLCARCLIAAAQVGPVDLAEAMESIAKQVHVHVQPFRCVVCGASGTTYEVYESPGA